MGNLNQATTRLAALTALLFLPAVHGQQCSGSSGQCGPFTTCADVGFPGYCCSQWGWCGTTSDYCGACCQNGPCTNPPPSPPPPPTPPTGFDYNVNHGEDSRLIAYVGNWQACPTPTQFDAYSHIVIAFAVSYTWDWTKNMCDTQCNVAPALAICNNANNQGLVDQLRSRGKKVILSFGGAGMGGSWSGDNNNCWDYCFGKEEQIATSLVTIVKDQKLDGVDIDYEYCYDIANTQAGRCSQRTAAYTDGKAQTFLNDLTSKLRIKLDALQLTNGYNRGRYTVTHAPMDSDLTTPSPYFQILKARRADLDFVMPQFYNGVTMPVSDGVDGTGRGSISAAVMFASLANDMFNSEPNKVVFGFCISDCGGTGSNANAAEAVQVMADLKTTSGGQFSCNGGAFFWASNRDINGQWSDSVVAEVSKTAGCSQIATPTPTSAAPSTATPTTPTPTTNAPTNAPTEAPTNASTNAPSSTPTTGNPTVSSKPTSSPTTGAPSNAPTEAPTNAPTNAPTEAPTNAPTNFPSRTPTTGAPSRTPTQSAPSSPPTPAPSPPPTVYPPCRDSCPLGATGNYPVTSCSGYIQCVWGMHWGTTACPAGTIFDVSLGVCNWSLTTTCQCGTGPPPPPVIPTPPPVTPTPPPPPPTSPPTPLPVTNPPAPIQGAGGNVWYPDWERTNTCSNDGLQPTWMPVSYFFASLETCCSAYFAWQQNCAPPTQGLYPWYPDWERTNTCANDGLQPNWMTPAQFFSSKADCCQANFYWQQSCV
ncbi:hypothetical protein ACHAW5_006648 [Stephanodiscus triporus]|uniref:Chitinase n=1 Tax=Stephanodiscus triporus TaxID=2934178 RepID=A0ABD3QHM6_9STRA